MFEGCKTMGWGECGKHVLLIPDFILVGQFSSTAVMSRETSFSELYFFRYSHFFPSVKTGISLSFYVYTSQRGVLAGEWEDLGRCCLPLSIYRMQC